MELPPSNERAKLLDVIIHDIDEAGLLVPEHNALSDYEDAIGKPYSVTLRDLAQTSPEKIEQILKGRRHAIRNRNNLASLLKRYGLRFGMTEEELARYVAGEDFSPPPSPPLDNLVPFKRK